MRREKGRMTVAVALAAAFIFPAGISVMASEQAKVSLETGSYSEADRSLEMKCMIENGAEVTNGKIRIFYDSEKAELKEAVSGECLKEAMSEINDCISGNKPEGELVQVFASAQEITSQGELMGMEFQIKEGVKKGEEIAFEVKVEKFAGDGGTVEAVTEKSVYVVGEGMKESAEEENAQEKEEETSGNNTGKKPDNGSMDTGSREEKKESSKNESKKSAGNVKTGDETPVGLYILGSAGALSILTGMMAVGKRKKQKKEKNNR